MTEHSRREKEFIKYLVRYGRGLVLAVETVIIASLSVLIALTTFFLARDIMRAYSVGSTAELQLIMNDIFLLIVYVELIRSIIAAYRRPEMYLVSIAEVGFVITVREVLASVLSKTTQDVLFSSLASIAFALILWILYRKVLPLKREHKERRRKEEVTHGHTP